MAILSSGVKGANNGFFGLALLSLINLVNYLDRYVVAGVLPKVENAFHLDHQQAGMLGGVFMAVYMCASPIAGYLGDRVPRRFLVAGSVLVWSLATAGSGLASSFVALLWARAITGIGEAGYGSVAPALISDLFPLQQRTRMLSYFYTAIPLGAAAGFVLGGTVSDLYSWNMAFFISGAPGVVLAFMALKLPDPPRGATEEGPVEKIPFTVGIRQLSGNRLFYITTIALTLMTFSIGGLAFWMPTFLEKERHLSGTHAGLALGAITVVAGFLGTIAGGILGDRLDRKVRQGGLLLSGLGLSLGAPFMVIAAKATVPWLMFTALFLAQFLIFLNSGPLNAAIMNCVPPTMRSFAMGLNTLIIHLLGDTLSPPLIGSLGKHFSLGWAIQINAIPVLAGGLIILLGLRWLSPKSAASGQLTLP